MKRFKPDDWVVVGGRTGRITATYQDELTAEVQFGAGGPFEVHPFGTLRWARPREIAVKTGEAFDIEDAIRRGYA